MCQSLQWVWWSGVKINQSSSPQNFQVSEEDRNIKEEVCLTFVSAVRIPGEVGISSRKPEGDSGINVKRNQSSFTEEGEGNGLTRDRGGWWGGWGTGEDVFLISQATLS